MGGGSAVGTLVAVGPVAKLDKLDIAIPGIFLLPIGELVCRYRKAEEGRIDECLKLWVLVDEPPCTATP